MMPDPYQDKRGCVTALPPSLPPPPSKHPTGITTQSLAFI